MTWIILIFAALLILAGLAGTILPALPGAPLIVAGALVVKLAEPRIFSWWIILLLVFMAALTLVIELLTSMAGAKWFGATRAGIIGAVIGGIIGLFFSLPGLILGPIAGACIGEWLVARRKLAPSLKAGVGTGVGLVTGLVLRVVLALGMVATILLAMFF